MNTFYTLLKTQLNANFGISALKYRFRKEKNRIWEPIMIGVAILAGIGPLLGLYIVFLLSLFTAGTAMGQPELVITISLILAQVLVLIFGIFYFLSSFYYSKDISMLIPLPLKPYEVVGSKFAVVMVNEYLIAVPAFAPAALIYGIGTGQGPLYWIKALLIMITVPSIPLILDALFVMLLMRFVNMRKHKDLLTIIGGFIGVAFAVGFNILMQRAPHNTANYYQELMKNKGLITAVSQKFPPSLWATRALADGSLAAAGNFLLFLGASVLLFFIMLWLANAVFYKGLIAGQEVTRKRKVLSSEELDRKYGKASSPVFSIFVREWRMIVRTPVYMINGLAGAVIGPLIVLVIFAAQSQSAEMVQIMQFIRNPEYSIYVALGGLAFILFTGGVNLVASTAVSREGNNFWISKMIPVSAEHQILGKFYSGFAVSAISIVVTVAILIVFVGFSIPRALALLVIGGLAFIPMTAFSLMLDLMRPKLVWSNPQEAMKQNMNGMLGILISMIIMAILGAAVAVLLLLQASEPVIYLALAVVSALLGLLSMKLLFSAAEARYKSLEA